MQTVTPRIPFYLQQWGCGSGKPINPS